MVSCLIVAVPASHAAFPGEDGKIAFGSNRDGNFEIYTINPDGTGLARLTNTSEGETTPKWSADGLRIAYSRGGYVWSMNADGSAQTRVTVGADPAWSPDGKKIVFARLGRDSEGGGIFVNDGITETKIAPGFRDSRDPEWSPDGNKIVFADAGLSSLYYIYTVNADGTGLTRITDTSNDLEPTWAPDGAKIAFRSPISPPSNVWVMNPDGSSRTKISSPADNESSPAYPAWSPSGTRFTLSRLGQNWDLTLMNADGSNVVNLTNDSPVDLWPDWQPAPDTPYARPKGATPVRTSLVPAYKPCAASNVTHGAPLAFPSCTPPLQASDNLTIGAESTGSLRADVVAGNPATPENEADVSIKVSVTDVRERGSAADYAGQLQADLPVRITDKDNRPAVGGPSRSGTVSDTSIPATVPCAVTADPAVGSACAVATTVNSLVPGAVKEALRSIWALDAVRVFDGGADGVASTAGDNTLFATQGVFVP